MSNPFRRSNGDGNRSTSDSVLPTGSAGTSTPPLTVNTRVTSSQKHVNFASPPAVPISPASYPSSPESTRQSPGFQHAQPYLPETQNSGQALYHDPFQEETPHDDDDRAIEQALRNARLNSALPAGSIAATTAKQANVRDTLSRFAATPRQQPGKSEDSNKKPTMDVNAFTRMLMTGQGGSSGTGSSAAPPAANDSGSSTDTTSVSQPSIFETGGRTVEEATQSSSDDERDQEPLPQSRGAKRRPPPPKPRHGKPVSDMEASTLKTGDVDTRRTSGTSQPEVGIQRTVSEDSDAMPRPISSDAKTSRKPPPPPLARRKSQKTAPGRPEITRSGSSRYSLSSDNDEPIVSPPPSARMAPPPPPPPSRRPNSQYGRRPSTDLPATYEQDENDSDAAMTERPPSSSKRISQASLGPPPPVPPPRKNKSSGRSSMDSQHRPSMAALGLVDGSARSSSELSRPGGEGLNASVASNAADILADLEALQREVDAARASAGR